MTAEQLFEYHVARPFKPFVISMADGRSYEVDHPEVLGYVPGARVATLWVRDPSAWRHLDVSMITSLDSQIAKRNRPRRRAS